MASTDKDIQNFYYKKDIENKKKIFSKFKKKLCKKFPKLNVEILNQKQLECLHLALEYFGEDYNDFINNKTAIIATDDIISKNPEIKDKVKHIKSVSERREEALELLFSLDKIEFINDDDFLIGKTPEKYEIIILYSNDDIQYHFDYVEQDDDQRYCIIVKK